jgi:DeoR family fructose operon transcriptional repressor
MAMSQKLRQDQILHLLENRKYITVKELIDTLQYSSATVNRDLNDLQALGLIKRHRGGAELAQQGHLPPLYARQFYKRAEKRRIAEAAARQVRDGDTLFLNGGTTVQYIAPFLHAKKELRIITNSLHLAIELGGTDFEVICLGGCVKERPHVLYGVDTLESVMKYRADRLFFSQGGITEGGDVEGGLLEKLMIRNSTEAWLLTDRTKLTDRLDTVMCDFSALTGVIADFAFPEETQKAFPDTKLISV